MRKAAYYVLTLLTGALMAANGAKGATLYGADRAGHLFTVNTTTGAGTLVGSLPSSTTEIVFDNITGRAWTQIPDGGFRIQEFDINTAAGIGAPVPDGGSYDGLQFVGSTLYGTVITGPGGPSSLRILNPVTGVSSLVGLTGVGPISGLAYNGTMYGIAGGPGPANLYTINLTTGVATVVGSTGIRAGSLEFGPDGNLYAGTTGGTGNLYRINPATGAGTLVGPTGFTDITGLTLVGAAASFDTLNEMFQIRYLANLSQGDSYVNVTNAGTLNGFDPAGRICVNVYTFDPAEELISCCACPVTPNGLNSLSARNDLISNTLTPGVPTSITVKLLSSLPLPGNTCNAASPNAANLVRGMRAWATTLHLNTSVLPAPGVYQQTETPFSIAELSASELSKLTGFCAFIQANGSGFGICKSCRSGALGAATQ